MITATALDMAQPVATSDPAFANLPGIEVVPLCNSFPKGPP